MILQQARRGRRRKGQLERKNARRAGRPAGQGGCAASVAGATDDPCACMRAQIWLPCMANVAGPTEERLLAVATTRLLCEEPRLAAPGAEPLWGSLLGALAQYLEAGGASSGEPAGAVPAYWALLLGPAGRCLSRGAGASAAAGRHFFSEVGCAARWLKRGP